jgi:phosphopantothenoylcysteine decarboxylase/phosphopantothenate--cysteine ligase
VQANLKTLAEHQVLILAPESGKQACGDIGEGRLAKPIDIAKQVGNIFQNPLE